MQVLEKILQKLEGEFDKRIETQLKIMAGLGDEIYRYGFGKSLEAYQQSKLLVGEIIRSHMADNDWIPVEEKGNPLEDGTYLCTLIGELCGIDEPFTGMCGYEDGDWDEPDCVLAWQPLPSPYQPKTTKRSSQNTPAT
ncbi:MAG: hypothetical protein Q4F83_11075 [Eubacteriales bacterium]|nr:hypothetical protein [Eubacteriales bacterium]